ncbi:MAG: hypothetical protein M3Q88_07430 [Pseudomonadota bacterium]|nr:hypothetical protein [Pseudomonadota bacterium]
MAIALVAGCNAKAETKPLLTKAAFVEAVRKCGAQEAKFIERFDGRAPSISFFETEAPGPQASQTSECLAEALKDYRLESMIIHVKPQKGAVR